MDQANQGQLSDVEQMMLGAQQVALLELNDQEQMILGAQQAALLQPEMMGAGAEPSPQQQLAPPGMEGPGGPPASLIPTSVSAPPPLMGQPPHVFQPPTMSTSAPLGPPLGAAPVEQQAPSGPPALGPSVSLQGPLPAGPPMLMSMQPHPQQTPGPPPFVSQGPPLIGHGPPQGMPAPPHMEGPPPQMLPPQQMEGMSRSQLESQPPQRLPLHIEGPPPQRLPPHHMEGPSPQRLPPLHIEGPPPQRLPPQDFEGPPPQRLPPPDFEGPPPQRLPPPDFEGPPPQRLPTSEYGGPPPQRLAPPHGDGPSAHRLPPQHLEGPPQQNLPPHIDGPPAQRLPPPHIEGQPSIMEGRRPQRLPSPQQEGPEVVESEQQPPSSGGSAGPGTSQTSGGSSKPSTQPREIKLPQALEKVLAFKGERAQQVGVRPEDVEKVEKDGLFEEEEVDSHMEDSGFALMQRVAYETYPDDEDEDDEDEEMEKVEVSSKKESKNKKRKKKKKRAKARKQMQDKPVMPLPLTSIPEENIEIEYIQEQLDIDRTDPSYREFSRIFQAFKISEESDEADQGQAVTEKEKPKPEDVPIKARGLIEDDDDDDDDDMMKPDDDDDKPRLSKKKQKKLNRLSVAELKQLVTRPDVVEMHDVTARDPKLLVHIKATRNSVPVPRHWCFKRKYLQGKRGIEKPPFDLPDFIKATGIMEMRQALQEKEDQKTMKSKMRERVRPKMGKIDIDYQKLHDAFFKWQTKPKLSIHGDLYYEGKEFETRLKEKKPGNLTDELRTALGMPVGPNADKYPPPWLIAMQRYGPPPSYPNLKIPGLNAPIPDGCAFGYHAGGWGKPPVDESGKALYGDVFGTQVTEIQAPVQEEEIDKTYWGELESESEEEESEEDSDEEREEDATGLVTPGDAGLVTPSGMTPIPIGVETPDMIELRKRRIEDAMDQGGDTPAALYQILPEKKAAVGGAMMGSAHVYDMTAVTAGKKAPDKPSTEGVEVALNPDELDLDTAAMQAKYDQTMREQQSQLEKEDLSDMVAEHAAKQQKKRKKQQQEGKSSKKYKEFKF